MNPLITQHLSTEHQREIRDEAAADQLLHDQPAQPGMLQQLRHHAADALIGAGLRLHEGAGTESAVPAIQALASQRAVGIQLADDARLTLLGALPLLTVHLNQQEGRSTATYCFWGVGTVVTRQIGPAAWIGMNNAH